MTKASRDTTMLQAEGVSKEVSSPSGTLTIVRDIDLSLAAGESMAIVGASGSGKSTLLGLLAGLDRPSRGKIHLAGHTIHAMGEDARAAVRARHVGFVFQAFHLLPGLTAVENVMLPMELDNQPDARERARSALAGVDLAKREAHYPRQLSGGEQQRVAIARAFATDPELLFADEPTGNLDNRTGETIRELLFEMNAASGTTLVLVTHDARLAERCRHRIALDDGMLAPLSAADAATGATR